MPTGDTSALASPPALPLTPPGSRPSTTFDHPYFATADIERPRAKLPETNLGFALAPTQVTMSTLRDIVRAALGYRVAPTNRARVMERRDQIEPTGPTAPTGPTCGRPPAATTRGWRCPAMPHPGCCRTPVRFNDHVTCRWLS